MSCGRINLALSRFNSQVPIKGDEESGEDVLPVVPAARRLDATLWKSEVKESSERRRNWRKTSINKQVWKASCSCWRDVFT